MVGLIDVSALPDGGTSATEAPGRARCTTGRTRRPRDKETYLSTPSRTVLHTVAVRLPKNTSHIMRTSILCKSLLTMALTIAFTTAQAQTTTACTECNDSIRHAKACTSCTAKPGQSCDSYTHKPAAHVRRAGAPVMIKHPQVRRAQRPGRTQGQHMMAQGRHMMAQGQRMMAQGQCKTAQGKKCKPGRKVSKKQACKGCNRFTPFSRGERMQMALAHIKGHGAINAKTYAKMTGLKRAMAEGELAAFCNMPNAGIKAKAEGKKTVYVLK